MSRALRLFSFACMIAAPSLAEAAWKFTEVAASAGFVYEHAFVGAPADSLQEQTWHMTGGAAAADYDGDGDVDLYAVRGSSGPNLLFENQGDGTFVERGAAAGVSGAPAAGSGPVFADIDGDGRLDLLVGGVDGSAPAVYRNLGGGSFEDVSAKAGFTPFGSVFSMALSDYDRDGDLDIAAVHWAFDRRVTLWANDGGGVFHDVTSDSGLVVGVIYGFSPTWTDLDGDGWVDLLVGADFGTSRVFRNNGDATFSEITTAVIDDENAMGAAAFDYDNDGDVDWFVTSIWDPDGTAEGNWGVSGNRFYENTGNGVFVDQTTSTNTREGYWGWGACAQDLDLDGLTDIFHTNGFDVLNSGDFVSDPSRLFLAQAGGTFTEVSASVGIVDTDQGRGLVCFDFDGDGDLDVFVANNGGAPSLFRNDDPTGGWLKVRLTDRGKNSEGVGAVVRMTIGGTTQMREIRAGTNFVSSEPAIAHFGTGAATLADEVRVEWPDGHVPVRSSVGTNQELVISRQPPAPVPAQGASATVVLAITLVGLATRRLRRRAM